MKTTLLFLIPAALFSASPYQTWDPNNIINPDPTWSVNGGEFNTSVGRSQISTLAYTGSATEYEVKTTLKIKSAGGTFVTYLRASSDAISGSGETGSFYAIELSIDTLNGTTCIGTLSVYKRVNNTTTLMATGGAACKDGMVWRIARNPGEIWINNDLGLIWVIPDNDIATGKPGFGARDLNTGADDGFSKVEIYPADTTTPGTVTQQSVAASVSSNQVDLQWHGVADDANGSGLRFYAIIRDGAYAGNFPLPTYSDPNVLPGEPHTYYILAVDYHGNYSTSPPIVIHTPSPGGIDPRRTGVRANGAYWGGMGEQIDMLSGNLNFTLPLLRAQGRGGWGVTFALNYNSANFRKDTAATWKMGRDSGYGFGWKFLAGSLTAYYSDWYTVHHYTFTDSTGAEYRLNQNSNGIWSSKESIYVRYDPVKNQMYFPDGSFWEFGALSSGIEEDAGTMYPTKMQDTNGNQILISYQTGTYALDPQSSSRITVIEDARAAPNSGSFFFTYTSETTPHLTAIYSDSSIGIGYSFTMASTALNSAIEGDASTFGTTRRLDTITGAFGLQHQMTYANSSCELTQVTFPYGGSLGWTYANFTFSDLRVIRDMTTRTLNDGVNGPKTYAFSHGYGANASNHALTQVVDASGVSFKRWLFNNATGLQSNLYEYSIPELLVRATDLTWTLDSDGNPYISSTVGYMDPTSSQVISRTDQTRDNFGNLTQMKMYDYSNLSTPTRIYNNTYYQPGNYINRLSTSTVTAGGSTTTLVVNGYDQPTYTNTPCGFWGQIYGGTPDTAREFDPTNNGNTYRGNLTSANSPGSTRCMYYDNAGVVLQTKDNNGHTVTSTPDPNHNWAVPSAVTTGNLTSTMTWNGAFQPLTATNPNGATAGLTYDNYARPVSTTSPYGAVTYFYYSNSPATKTTVTKQRWAKTTMDGFGRSVKEEAGYGYGTSTVVTLTVAETQYAPCGCTPMGKTKQVSVPHAPNATAAWTTYNYDALGRTIGVVQPNNAGTTQYSYMGNTVTVTDPALAWKTFITDAMGNLTQVTEPNPAGGTFITYYTYSTLNQLLTVSMPRPSVPGGGTVTQTRSFVYNSDQRLQSVTNPESGTTSYTYYPDGSLLTKTDAKGQVITYYYDEFGRLTQVKNGLIFLRTLTYDANGYGSYLNGRLARVDYVQANSQYRDDGNVWTEMYSYDPAGGMLKKKLTLAKAQNNPGSLEATWTYDDEGKMTSIKYPNSLSLTGTTYTYTFDSMGRPLSLSDGTTNIASGATYGPAGEMTALSYSGIAESRSYNDQKQLTGISIYGLGSIGYNYSATNNNGRIASMNNTFTGENVTYAYDSLNRLITATASGQWGLSFSYDGFGNRLSQTVMLGSAPTIQQSYDQTTNRQLGQTYDANGNNLLVVNYGALATYDVENRLITSNINSYNETYEYGIDNKRIYKLTPGTTNLEQVYFYAGGRKIATYNVYKAPDNNGNIWITFAQSSYDVYFGGKLIVSGGQGVVLDRLGSVVARYNGNNMYETHAYFPYGEERTTTANNRDKFGTYFRDASSGLDYADQRFYSSINARFLTADPYQASGGSEDPGSWNRYEYVLADPINLYDPEGLFASAGSTRKEYEDEVLKWERMNHAASGVGPYYWYYWNPGGVGGGGGGGGQVKGGGGGASSAAPPQSQTNDPCPADKRAFFNQMGIYKSMASDMDTNVDFIIGLSALETGWGTSPASKNGHNLFGASDYKEVPLSYSGYQASADAWETRWAKDVRGVKDARTFYTNLVKDQYNTHKGYVDVLLKMGHAVTLFKKLCGVT